MNDVKKLGFSIEGHIAMIESHLRTQVTEAGGTEELARLKATEPQRWLAMARSDFQTALIKMTRAVAQPTSF